MDKKVYDYNIQGYWVEPFFLILFGLIWTPFWIYSAVHGPIPLTNVNDVGKATGETPNWVGFLLALLGIAVVALGVRKAVIMLNEQVRIEDGNLIYVDWRRQVRLHCRLSEVRGLLLLGAPYRFANGRSQGLRAYRVETTQGSFVFFQTIRNGTELFQTLSDQIEANNRGTALDSKGPAAAHYRDQI